MRSFFASAFSSWLLVGVEAVFRAETCLRASCRRVLTSRCVSSHSAGSEARAASVGVVLDKLPFAAPREDVLVLPYVLGRLRKARQAGVSRQRPSVFSEDMACR